MGYETHFQDLTPMTEEQLEKLSSITGWEVEFGQSMKWYEWQKDIATMSIYFPDVLFHISGDGEENDDEWDAYFQDGKSVKLDIIKTKPVFEPENMLRIVYPIPIPIQSPPGMTIILPEGDPGNISWDF